jgi:hypothetical protein
MSWAGSNLSPLPRLGKALRIRHVFESTPAPANKEKLSCGVHLGSPSGRTRRECCEYADGGLFAVLTVDFVDQNELYPYIPHGQRFWQDITAMLAIRSRRQTRLNPRTGKMEEQPVVVMTCSSFVKLHCAHLDLPPLAQHQLREQLGQRGGVILRSIGEQMCEG